MYYTYFRMEHQGRMQVEKKQRNDVVSYDALDNGETVGLESIPDMISPQHGGRGDGERDQGKASPGDQCVT